jgi:hypothetical protein
MITVEVTNTPDDFAPFYCELDELCEMNELDRDEVLAALHRDGAYTFDAGSNGDADVYTVKIAA